MFTAFDLKTVASPSSTHVDFDHGIEYPAQILGIWNAEKEYQGTVKRGMALLVLIQDNNDKPVYRSLFMSLDGYVLGSRATYARIMQGLLRCSDTDEALRAKIDAAGLSDIRALVGKPCRARMAIKENGGKSWAYIDALSGETPKYKGISDLPALEPVDIERVCGKFIKIPSVSDCEHVKGLTVINPASDGIEDGMEDVMRDTF